jgi:hypothetical protein
MAIASEQLLFVAELEELAWRTTDLSFAWVAAPGSRDPYPARVVFAGGRVILADHPRFGRVTIERIGTEPELVKGDAILFDKLRETLPGRFVVERWHKQGTAAADDRDLTIVVEASTLPSLRAPFEQAVRSTGGGGGGKGEALRRVAEQLGFQVSPMLAVLLERFDTDAGFCRLLERVSFRAHVTGISTAPFDTDPCLIGLAEVRGGDAITSLYYYPAAHERGAALPVVQFSYDPREVTWLAPTFEAFFDRFLCDAAADHAAEVAAIREALEFPKAALPATRAPDWFTGANATPELARERALVLALDPDGADVAAKTELAALYARLGWAWHREQLLRD